MARMGHQSSWQYFVEDTPENPTSAGIRFMLPGVVSGETPIDIKNNLKAYRGLLQPSDTDMRRIQSLQASKNEYSWNLTYIPCKRLSDPKYDFRHFFGLAMNASSSTSAGGGWTYGTACATALRTFSVFKEIDNMQTWLKGCKVGRITVRSSLDNPVEIAAEGKASTASFTDLAKTDATNLLNATPFMWSDTTIYIDGSLATNCTAFEVNLNNNDESDWVLGDRDPKGVNVKGRQVDGVITRQYTDTGQYAAMKNGTAKSITINLDDSTDAQIILRDAKWEDHPVPGAGDGILTHQLRFQAETLAVN